MTDPTATTLMMTALTIADPAMRAWLTAEG